MNINHSFSILLLLLFLSSCNLDENTETDTADLAPLENNVRSYTDCIQNNGDNKFDCYYFRGKLYMDSDEHELAIKDFTKSINVPPHFEGAAELKCNAFWNMAIIYSEQGRKKNAYTFYKKALEHKDDPMLYNNIGLVEIKLGKYDEALVNLNHAIERDKNNAFALNNRALLYLKQENHEAAMKDIKASENINPNNSYIYFNKALYFESFKDNNLICENLNLARIKGYLNSCGAIEKAEYEAMFNKYCE